MDTGVLDSQANVIELLELEVIRGAVAIPKRLTVN